MDVIIQIIIVIVIISSVLKQIKAVSDKSGDLGKPKPPGQGFDMDDTVKPAARTTKNPSAVVLPQEPVRSRPGPISFPVTIEEEDFAAVIDQTDSSEIEPYMLDGTGEEMPPEPIQSDAFTSSRPAPPVNPYLDFSGQEVTRGIIMREILGPPVSLREGELL